MTNETASIIFYFLFFLACLPWILVGVAAVTLHYRTKRRERLSWSASEGSLSKSSNVYRNPNPGELPDADVVVVLNDRRRDQEGPDERHRGLNQALESHRRGSLYEGLRGLALSRVRRRVHDSRVRRRLLNRDSREDR